LVRNSIAEFSRNLSKFLCTYILCVEQALGLPKFYQPNSQVEQICQFFLPYSMFITSFWSQLFDDKVKITTPVSILHCSILRLCLQLDIHFTNSTQQNLITEWKDFFSPAITDAIILQFKHILKHSKLPIYFLYIFNYYFREKYQWTFCESRRVFVL